MNKLKEELLSGKTMIGVGITLNDPRVVEQVQLLDYVWIDTEHSPKDYQVVDMQILAAKAYGLYSLVRVPSHDPFHAKRILEMKPDGIIFPNVATVDEAKTVMDACIYPPHGKRGYGPQRAQNFGYTPQKQYLEEVTDAVCRIIQVEDRECVANLEKILKVPFIDACFIGLHDLSASIGRLGDPLHKDVVALCEIALKKCKDANVPIGVGGISGFNMQDVQLLSDKGFRFFFLGCDYDFITAGTKRFVENIQIACKK